MSMKNILGMSAMYALLGTQPFNERKYAANSNVNCGVDPKPNRRRAKPNTFKKSKKRKNKTQYLK